MPIMVYRKKKMLKHAETIKVQSINTQLNAFQENTTVKKPTTSYQLTKLFIQFLIAVRNKLEVMLFTLLSHRSPMPVPTSAIPGAQLSRCI